MREIRERVETIAAALWSRNYGAYARHEIAARMFVDAAMVLVKEVDAQCMAEATDGGPTDADLSGEVVHG